MAYTREQRAANAGKAAMESAAAARSMPEPVEQQESLPPPPPEGRAPIPRKNDPRNAALEEIEAEHERRSGNEQPAVELPMEPVNEPKPEAQAAPQPEAPQVEPGSSPAEPVAQPVAEAEAPKTVRVKVDGQEFDVPQTEVDDAGGIAPYQKLRAADNRLRAANEAIAEAKRQMAQSQALAQQFAQQAQPQQPKASNTELWDAILGGSPEQRAAAQAELETRMRGPQVDQRQMVLQTVAINRFNEAERSFMARFPEVTTNPDMGAFAQMLKNQEIAKMRAPDGSVNWSALANVDFGPFFSTIENRVRSVVGKQHQPTPAAPTPTGSATPAPAPSQSREARKASIVTLPTSSARAALPVEETEQSREDIINSLAKTRGKAPIH